MNIGPALGTATNFRPSLSVSAANLGMRSRKRGRRTIEALDRAAIVVHGLRTSRFRPPAGCGVTGV
ncbi:MAG TPA: hypothetical protein VGF40_13655, partial [Thermoanaerobaculia bacterium]